MLSEFRPAPPLAACVAALFCLFATSACSRTGDRPQDAEGARLSPDRTMPWSERMALSEMSRRGESLARGKAPQAKWRYETGVFLKGLERVWVKSGDDRYFRYIKDVVDSYVGEDGAIATYRLEDYNLDSINSGKVLLALYEKTKEPKYSLAAGLLMKQLETQPRVPEGGFWHKRIYPNQMWLDGIYMASPFYAQYAKAFGLPAAFDDVVRQIVLVGTRTRDQASGLLYHAWDSAREQPWADPLTGCSRNFWARAIGWYAMGIVDVLDYLPADHGQRKELIGLLERTLTAIRNCQDPDSGLWYQVLDQGGRPGNYLEASASCMFVYAMAKGVRTGSLGSGYLKVARKGYEGILRRLIRVDPDGAVSLTQICSSAGLGGPKQRSGTFDYYVSEPVVTNDLKGVGPFVLASVEMELLAAPENP